MNDKGLVERNTLQKTYLYLLILPENKAKTNLISEFITRTFRGSVKDLVLHKLYSHKATQKEIEEIKAFGQSLENKC